VTFHSGFSADIGGGEYDRGASLDLQLGPIATVPAPHATLQPALTAVRAGGAVEIGDSGRYVATPEVRAAAGARIELRGADGARPALVLNGVLRISGADDAEVTLNGLLVTGGTVRVVEADNHQRLRRLRLRHCTLVPDSARRQWVASGSRASLVVETATPSRSITASSGVWLPRALRCGSPTASSTPPRRRSHMPP
jgi:hypothetical protein